MLIPVATIRLTWLVIEEVQSPELLRFSDTGLIRFLLQRVAQRRPLSGEEVHILYEYIGSQIPLIRERVASAEVLLQL